MIRCAPRRFIVAALLIAPLVVVAAGCPRLNFEVRLEPNDRGLQRTLTVWLDGVKKGTSPQNVRPDQPPQDELTRRLVELFPERLTTDADLRQSFRGTFADKMPADVGGSGRYEAIESPLGTAYWYVERFRGSDDFDAQLYDRRASADRLTDLVVGWFDLELKGSPHKDAAHRWLHQDFRQDLRNVTAFFLVSHSRPNEDADEDETPAAEKSERVPDGHPLLRVAQYCIERGYLSPAELTLLTVDDEKREVEVLRLARRMLGKSAKLSPQEADKAFAFLAPTKECEESWRDYLRTTPEYARLLSTWKKSKKPSESEPDPMKVVEQLIMPTLVDPALLPAGDLVRVSLKTRARPYLLNGEYDAHESTVNWSGSLSPSGYGLPLLCTAAWSVPDEKFQTAHFGRVVLKGKKLAQFAALYREVPEPLRSDFAKHLASLKPSDALADQLRARDFKPTDPSDKIAPAAAAAVGRMFELLSENLK